MGQAAIKIVDPIDIRTTVVDSARHYLSEHKEPEHVEAKLNAWLVRHGCVGLTVAARYRYPAVIEVVITGFPNELDTIIW